MRTRAFELVDPAATLIRLMKLVEPQGDCEVFTGSRKRKGGHGVMSVKTPAGWWVLNVHRVRWTIERGPIPLGMVLDHLADRCTSAACVRLDHLEVVTQAENARRSNVNRGVPEVCAKCGASDWVIVGASQQRRCRPCRMAYTRQWQREKSGQHPCHECGAMFTRTLERTGFCSAECARENSLRRHRDFENEKYSLKPRDLRVCRQCGASFMPSREHKFLCSTECATTRRVARDAARRYSPARID